MKDDARRMRVFAACAATLAAALLVIAVLGVVGILGPAPQNASLFVLATLAFGLAAVAWLGSRPAAPSADRVGGYKLVELLGKGGMGEVWRAEHASLVRPAAVKVLRGELLRLLPPRDLAELEQRFRREVQMTATLTCPHTVAIYDFGQTPERTLYYVMELLHGVDLEYLVNTFGPQPAERVVHWLRQICESLAEAHNRKLIHRDIKPANIYVCAVGMTVDFAKVLDFGLVRDLAEGDQRLTIQGTTPGTPAYLAPEAVDDKLEPRSDLYALGCVAYWLLTGGLVFDADSRVAMLTAHRSQPPAPPSRRTELPIPRELDYLVLSLLEKDPAKRPQSATDLAKALAAIPLATPWTPERAEAWWQSHLPQVLAKTRDRVAPRE